MTQQSEPALRFELPLPPSVNALYKRTLNRRGRRPKTAAYEAWITEAGWALKQAAPHGAAWWNPSNSPPLPLKHCRVEVEMPVDYRRDLDNCMKPVLDLLVAHGVIVDDRWVEELRVRRVEIGQPMIVSLWPLNPA